MVSSSMTSGGQTLEYTYNDNDQLLNIKNGTEIVAQYTYDLSGNRISDGEKTYSFNEANQLTSVQKNSIALGSYTYDATGQRLSDGATDYLYDGLNLLGRTTADSAASKFVKS